MIHRYRSDELDRALDLLVERGSVDAGPRLQPLLEVARATRQALHVELPAELADRHLAALSELEVAPARRRWSRRKRVAVVLLAAALALGAMVETAAASTNALPGELLYPVKRAVEKIELAIHRDPTSRAGLHLKFAQRRLQELSELLALRRAGQKVDIGAAMSAYSSEVAKVEGAVATGHLGRGAAALLGRIEDELSNHLSVLTDLRDKISSPQARAAIERAIERAQNTRQDVKKGQPKERGKPSKTPSGPPRSRGPGSHGR